MDHQPIIQISTVLHPNLMFLFGSQLRLFIHWRELIINFIILSYSLNFAMIREILKSSRFRRDLYKNRLVCGCVYRSFSDLEAGIFFRFAMNNGTLSKQQILDMIDRSSYTQNQQKFLSIIDNFHKLQILEIVRTFDTINYKLNQQFVTNIESFIKQQVILTPVNLQMKPIAYQPRPFEFLQILFDNKLPRKCKLSAVYPQATCLTKDQFIYIKSDISYKIGVLIDGIINEKENDIRNIQSLVMLNLLDSDQYYCRTQRLNSILQQLQKIKLVQICGPNNEYFRISKYLQHFTFKTAKDKQMNTKLNCSIIIETNFKVFVTIKSEQLRQNKVIKKILSMLLKSDREGIQCQKLFIGEINMEFMKTQIFNRTCITTSQYFDFFKLYTDYGEVVQKDLGKWKKLKFIGLEGPSEDSNIPSNIRQEVKLWEHLKDYKDQ